MAQGWPACICSHSGGRAVASVRIFASLPRTMFAPGRWFAADGGLALVNVDQLLASEEQLLLAEAQAMERMCTEAFAGQEVGAWGSGVVMCVMRGCMPVCPGGRRSAWGSLLWMVGATRQAVARAQQWVYSRVPTVACNVGLVTGLACRTVALPLQVAHVVDVIREEPLFSL